MKIILSRKGFDSANGGCASPIMPDGTLLSMPIPSDDGTDYEALHYHGYRYSDLLMQLNPKMKYEKCHLDPDIRDNSRIVAIPEWRPAFGQCDSSQGLLKNAGVEKEDIFLFFGWFRQIEIIDGKIKYVRRSKSNFYHSFDLHVIYGYMQIGEIITDKKIKDYYWHPHAIKERKNNALYIPTDSLSILPDHKGYGVLDYRNDRVLTMEGQNRGTWKELGFLMPSYVYGNKKNSAKAEGLYYCGIWQELVINESEALVDWVKSIIE